MSGMKLKVREHIIRASRSDCEGLSTYRGDARTRIRPRILDVAHGSRTQVDSVALMNDKQMFWSDTRRFGPPISHS